MTLPLCSVARHRPRRAAGRAAARSPTSTPRPSSSRRPGYATGRVHVHQGARDLPGRGAEAAGQPRFRRVRLRAAVGHAEPDPARRPSGRSWRPSSRSWSSAPRSCSSGRPARERELLDPIQTKVNSVIEGVRAAGNYAMIFDVSAPNSGIVTADKSLDLTAAGHPAAQVRHLSRVTSRASHRAGGRRPRRWPPAWRWDGAGARRVGPLERAGPEALSLAVSARYADALASVAAPARCWSPKRWPEARPGPSPHRRRATRTRRWSGSSSSSSRRAVRARASIPRRASAPGARSARTCRIGPYVVLGRGVHARATASGSRRASSLGDGVSVGEDSRARARASSAIAGSPHREPGGAQGGSGDRRRRVRLPFRRRRARPDSPRRAAASSRTTWRSAPTPVSTGAASTTR